MTEQTTGTKHDTGKPKMGLISGIFLTGLANVLTLGARKYAAHNWRKGFQLSRPYDALQRHLVAFWEGEDLDPEWGLSHLDHAACELMFLRELWQTRPDLDDRFKTRGAAQAEFDFPTPSTQETANKTILGEPPAKPIEAPPPQPEPIRDAAPFSKSQRVSARLGESMPFFPAVVLDCFWSPVLKGWAIEVVEHDGRKHTVQQHNCRAEKRA